MTAYLSLSVDFRAIQSFRAVHSGQASRDYLGLMLRYLSSRSIVHGSFKDAFDPARGLMTGTCSAGWGGGRNLSILSKILHPKLSPQRLSHTNS